MYHKQNTCINKRKNLKKVQFKKRNLNELITIFQVLGPTMFLGYFPFKLLSWSKQSINFFLEMTLLKVSKSKVKKIERGKVDKHCHRHLPHLVPLHSSEI